MADEKLEIIISATDKASEVFKDIGKEASDTGGILNGVLKVGAVAAGAGIVALGGFLATSVGEAIKAQDTPAQLAAVLQATGGAAGVTAQEANDLADELSGLTRFSKDTVLAAESVLLRFKNIGEDVFPQVIGTAADLAQTLGIDMTSAATMLGKALEDPGVGLMRLKAAGVSFTAEQDKMLKSMVESGNAAGAQKFILDALQKSIGGTASAAGDTLAGQMDKLRNRFTEIQVQVGTLFLPILQKLADGLLNALNNPAVQQGLDALKIALGLITDGNITSGLVWIARAFGLIDDETVKNAGDFVNLQNILVSQLQPILTQLITFLQANAQPILIALGAVLVGVIIPALASMAIGAIIAAAPIIALAALVALMATAWNQNWGGIQQKTQAVISFLQTLINGALQQIQGWWTLHGDNVKTIVTGFMTFIQNLVNTVLNIVKQFWQAHGAQVQAIAQGLWDALTSIFNIAAAVVTGIVDTLAAAMKGDWDGVKVALITMAGAIWVEVEKLFNLGSQAVVNILNNLVQTVKGLATNFFNAAISLGNAIIKGIQQGVEDLLEQITQRLARIAQQMLAAAKAAIGIQSPSKAFMEVGQMMMQGWQIGIEQNAHLPIAATAGVASATHNVAHTTINNFHQTVHSNARHEQVAQDYLLMKHMVSSV